MKKEKNYFYLVNESTKTCAEFYEEFPTEEFIKEYTDKGLKFYDHFPYVEYGFEDPYNFIAEWYVYNEENRLLTVFVGERKDGTPIIVGNLLSGI